MRILINAYSARLGGGQTYLINLLRRLPEGQPLELLVYAPASLRAAHRSSHQAADVEMADNESYRARALGAAGLAARAARA